MLKILQKEYYLQEKNKLVNILFDFFIFAPQKLIT